MAQIRPPYMKVICPTAPTVPVTLNAGFRMPSWFDLKTLDMYGPEDEEGIRAATLQIQSLIQTEISAGKLIWLLKTRALSFNRRRLMILNSHARYFVRTGIPANRIMLGGFSQGGALALHTGLTFNQTLAGVIALSCWLPIHKSFPDARKASENLPIFQCHGEVDPVVPYKFGQLSHVNLKSFMKNAQFNSYPGLSHSSSQQEMDDVKVWGSRGCWRFLPRPINYVFGST